MKSIPLYQGIWNVNTWYEFYEFISLKVRENWYSCEYSRNSSSEQVNILPRILRKNAMPFAIFAPLSSPVILESTLFASNSRHQYCSTISPISICWFKLRLLGKRRNIFQCSPPHQLAILCSSHHFRQLHFVTGNSLIPTEYLWYSR